VTHLPAFQNKGQFSPQLFQQALASLSISQAAFIKQIQDEMLQRQVQRGITNSAIILSNEVAQSQALKNQRRNVVYWSIPAKTFVNKVKVSDEAVKNYYASHQKLYHLPEQVQVKYIQLRPEDLEKSIHVDDAQAKKYYQDNLINYRHPQMWQISDIFIPFIVDDSKSLIQAKQKADDISRKIKNGESATLFAQQYPSNLGVQNDVWTLEADLPMLLQPVIKKMRSAGVTSAIKNDKGFHIVTVNRYQAAKNIRFATVKKKITQHLRQQQLEKKFAEASDEVAELSYTTPDTLAVVAKKYHLLTQTTAKFGKGGGDRPLTKFPKIVAAAFSDDVLMNENNSAPITFSDSSIIVLRLGKHYPASIKPLADVKASIVATLQHQEALLAAKKIGAELLTLLKQHKNINKFVQSQHLSKQRLINISRQQKGVDTGLLQALFSLPSPDAQPVFGEVTVGKAVFVLKLTKASSPPKAAVSASATQQLRSEYAGMEFKLYTKQHLENAKIEIKTK
jgi:peptidyl-prolyl cis-trans isomerase D